MATGGSGVSGQGLNGGTSNATSPPWPTGGGGGWKSPGESPTSTTRSGSGGEGGWTTMTGTKVYYAGGGGGGSTGGTPGRGGIGGGGDGGITKGQSGASGTGGGGGGTSTGTSGGGGSGIVIIRYEAKYPDLVVTGSPIYQNIGEAKVYQFLTSGTVLFPSKTVIINDSSLPIPTYSITPSSSTVDEGASATFTVTTTYVKNNTTLYWKNTGTRLGLNFDDGASTGTVTIVNNTGTIVRPVKANNAIDSFGAGTIIISLYTDNAYNNLLTSSTTVTVNDTSWPDPVVDFPTRIIFGSAFNYSVTGDKIGGTFTITNPVGFSSGPTSYPGGNTGNFSGSLTIASGAFDAGTYDFTFTFSSGKTVVVKSVDVNILTYVPVEYLVVAGGGGGATYGGGGGGGGVRSGSGYNIIRGVTLTVNVGSSGSPAGYGSYGGNGGNSEISGLGMTTITSIGGGGGGAAFYTSGLNGGSGGGGAMGSGGYGSGTTGQGNRGGSGGPSYTSGGGGGATTIGGDGAATGGNGGTGFQWINGNYYGGGGGGCSIRTTVGTGGTGGGGAGGCNTYFVAGSGNGTNGIVSTGGGGGAGGYFWGSGWGVGGSGGSGIVIIRYPSIYPEATVPNNVASTNSGGYRTYTFANSATFLIS